MFFLQLEGFVIMEHLLRNLFALRCGLGLAVLLCVQYLAWTSFFFSSFFFLCLCLICRFMGLIICFFNASLCQSQFFTGGSVSSSCKWCRNLIIVCFFMRFLCCWCQLHYFLILFWSVRSVFNSYFLKVHQCFSFLFCWLVHRHPRSVHYRSLYSTLNFW